jgi:quercetin 2,3-dioxygenase
VLSIRKASERGAADHDWLKSKHTFSFAEYRDPSHMGFRALRVINEDIVEPGEGFGTHPHRDMEILTYVLEGELAHRDSMGNGRIIKAGEVQAMSAGTGITHSEFNASDLQRVHFLQIWIMPHTKDVLPTYSEWTPDGLGRQSWAKVAASDGSASIHIHQDTIFYLGNVQSG